MSEESDLLERINLGLGMDPKKREGTFAHSHICQVCGLHFVVYSWKKETDKMICPECGYSGLTYHQVKKVKGEIFNYCPVPGSKTAPDAITRRALKGFLEVAQNSC